MPDSGKKMLDGVQMADFSWINWCLEFGDITNWHMLVPNAQEMIWLNKSLPHDGEAGNHQLLFRPAQCGSNCGHAMSKVDWWERYCSIVVTPTNSRVKTCPPFKKQTTILGVTITQSSASQQRIPPLFIAWGRDATLYGAAFGWAGLGDAGHRKGSPSDPGETATQVHGAHTFSWGWGDLNLNFSFYMYIYIYIYL